MGPGTSVKEIAALLFEKRISGVPVLDEGRLVGLVSEGDLLHHHEIGTDRAARTGSWWLRMFSAEGTPAEYVKSHAASCRGNPAACRASATNYPADDVRHDRHRDNSGEPQARKPRDALQ